MLTPFLASELAGTARERDRWFWGGFPPVHGLRGDRARGGWLDSYVSTFLARDVPAVGLRLLPHRLRTLWTMLTHVHGSLLNVSDLARSLGVSGPTVQGHLDVLESAFLVRRLHPFHANIRKRLTKGPKIYIRDTGLLQFLAGLRRSGDLPTWPRRGASFEGMVIEEIAALAGMRVVRPGIHFRRTQAGAEVDLLISSGRRIAPVEIKAGASVDHRDVAGLRQCMKDLSRSRGWVVYTGKERRSIGGSIEAVPWDAVVRGEVDFGW